MTLQKCTHHIARRDQDGTWSIVDMRTGKIAVIAETMSLERLDEATAMEIIDALHDMQSTSVQGADSAAEELSERDSDADR